ncbi:MAG: 3-dehydroquinate synthase [candidate division Zixibacteria bacterium]|nr:3-dehydroquinate synthase [candidate division Zixibacteria bacterium]MCI0596719.1 3-dehydroquinate synthase [candidate division Zixibacteria bacterium]
MTPELVIKTPTASCPVFVGRGIRRQLGDLIRNLGAFEGRVVITDRAVARYHLDSIESSLPQPAHFIVIPEGEASKSLGEYERVMGELLQKKLGRDFLLIAFGGGVVGDLAGYIAATYKRGVPYLQLPTTLLAQVDSSVGGKVGINHPLGKNLIGALYHPKAVVIDPEFLLTLPRREIISGFAEVVKYAFLKKDGFLAELKLKLPLFLDGNWEGVEAVILHALSVKAELVEKDEEDRGARHFLNLGHTFGHALEQATGFGALRHGEAVVFGMAAAFQSSLFSGRMGREECDEALALLEILGNEIPVPDADVTSVMKGMEVDKKRKKDALVFVLPTAIGEVEIVENLDEKIIRESLSFALRWAAELKTKKVEK